jgi:hypothetical protein
LNSVEKSFLTLSFALETGEIISSVTETPVPFSQFSEHHPVERVVGLRVSFTTKEQHAEPPVLPLSPVVKLSAGFKTMHLNLAGMLPHCLRRPILWKFAISFELRVSDGNAIFLRSSKRPKALKVYTGWVI